MQRNKTQRRKFVDEIAGDFNLSLDAYDFLRKYDIERSLGHGGYGNVYLVRRNRNLYAMKIVKVDKSDVDSVRRELEILKVVSYEPDCSLYVSCLHDYYLELPSSLSDEDEDEEEDIDESSDENVEYTILFLVLEYIQGYSLYQLMEIGFKRFTEDEIYELAIQLFKGLEYIHSKGIAHQDIKDDNIMIIGEAQLKIIDLGVGCFVNNDKYQCNTNEQAGNVFFMSPEMYQLRERDFTLADIWSAGLVIWQLLFYSSNVKNFDKHIPSIYNLRGADSDENIDQKLEQHYRTLDVRNPKLYGILTSSVAVVSKRLSAKQILDLYS